MSGTDRLKEAAAGGLAGLAVVTIYIIARAKLIGASDGDWLSFAGAVAGSGLAVAGAVWIEHWKRSRERRAEAQAILASVIRLRSVSDMILKGRSEDIPEPEWQNVVNQMPENIAVYASRLDRALDRLTTATVDFDVVEAGDMVSRAAKRVTARFGSGDTNQVQQAIASLELLRNSCDVAEPMLTSRLTPGKPLTFAEAIEGRGRRLN